MELEGSKVLVTGGAGLIGSHVVDQLVAKHPKEIVIFDKNASEFYKNPSPELDYGNVRLLDGDITVIDEVKDALRGIDYVVHTASLLTREAAGDLRAGFEVNICGTFNLIEASIASNVKKFVYSSSISIYGNPLAKPMAEDHPFNISSMYGAGKAACELLLKVIEKAKGMEYLALRYAVVYGPRQHYRGNLVKYIPESFDRIADGLPPIIYGDGSQPYDYVFVEDVARANVLALKSSVSGEALNIGTGITATVGEVVQMIVDITGTTLEPSFEPQGDRFGLKSLFLDTSKAEKLLGFRAEVSLREGLACYYEWLKRKRAQER